MRTIVEPKEQIDKLWGKQRIRDGDTYRMMNYVLRDDYDGKVLLHNVVTGRLVVLSHEEMKAVDKLPRKYGHEFEQLVAEHYLVPEDYDEHQQVMNLRSILRKLGNAYSTTDITSYVILPTTACNARCYYCYQQGIPTATMSEQTADQVVEFISSHCGANKRVFITWFGGEPTVAAQQIDRICKGLNQVGVLFRSFMISNGYLFDSDVVRKAKTLWNLQRIQITIDGTEDTYNRTKAYVSVSGSPYQRVMHNVELLLSNEIAVGLRMNYDMHNWHELEGLLSEIKSRFHNNGLLRVVVHQILGEHTCEEGTNRHGSPDWFAEKQVEMNRILRDAGLSGRIFELPYTRFEPCQAASDAAAIITPDGNLVSCPEKIGDDQILGNVYEGVTNHELAYRWKQFAEYEKCRGCCLFPFCIHMQECVAQGKCTSQKAFLDETSIAMKQKYQIWMKTEEQEE